VHAADRAQALAEVYRIVRPGGVVVAAAISRWARPLVRAAVGQLGEPDWHEHTLKTMRDGHVPDGDDWERCVYLHDAGELAAELTTAGFGEVAVVGVEGPIGPWARKDPTLHQHAMDLARQAETELAACSIHLLACGTRPSLARNGNA
jgi:SAM-dependent methyltransferase